MITVKPIEDKMRKEQLLSKHHGSFTSGEILVMNDGECELGYAVIDLEHGKLSIDALCLPNGFEKELNEEEKLYIDFLMRAAASYGANHGAYQMENRVAKLHSFFVSKGFSLEDGMCTIPISKIVRICKPHHAE